MSAYVEIDTGKRSSHAVRLARPSAKQAADAKMIRLAAGMSPPARAA